MNTKDWLPLIELLKKSGLEFSEGLIPILGGRYMPELPYEAGNPVFSVHPADIIYYGFDLEDYLRHEFNLPREEWPSKVRRMEFWDPDRFQELRWG
jgi:hypothetical protein